MPSYSRSVKIRGKSADELYATVDRELRRFLDKMSIGDYQVEPRPETKTFELKSKAVSATLYCRDEEFTLEGKLSLMLLPFKSKIDEGIDKWLAKTFGDTTKA